jgi:hypothetical protein
MLGFLCPTVVLDHHTSSSEQRPLLHSYSAHFLLRKWFVERDLRSNSTSRLIASSLPRRHWWSLIMSTVYKFWFEVGAIPDWNATVDITVRALYRIRQCVHRSEAIRLSHCRSNMFRAHSYVDFRVLNLSLASTSLRLDLPQKWLRPETLMSTWSVPSSFA